jgi:hypothetical protein
MNETAGIFAITSVALAKSLAAFVPAADLTHGQRREDSAAARTDFSFVYSETEIIAGVQNAMRRGLRAVQGSARRTQTGKPDDRFVKSLELRRDGLTLIAHDPVQPRRTAATQILPSERPINVA